MLPQHPHGIPSTHTHTHTHTHTRIHNIYIYPRDRFSHSFRHRSLNSPTPTSWELNLFKKRQTWNYFTGLKSLNRKINRKGIGLPNHFFNSNLGRELLQFFPNVPLLTTRLMFPRCSYRVLLISAEDSFSIRWRFPECPTKEFLQVCYCFSTLTDDALSCKKKLLLHLLFIFLC